MNKHWYLKFDTEPSPEAERIRSTSKGSREKEDEKFPKKLEKAAKGNQERVHSKDQG